jgi:quinol monooxygenase YgiN
MSEVALTVVAGTFDARPGAEGDLASALAHYVVLTRGAPGCRNVDLVSSLLRPGRFLVVEKWSSPEGQQAHITSDVMATLAAAAAPLLASPPELELYEAVSAHDLT